MSTCRKHVLVMSQPDIRVDQHIQGANIWNVLQKVFEIKGGCVIFVIFIVRYGY